MHARFRCAPSARERHVSPTSAVHDLHFSKTNTHVLHRRFDYARAVRSCAGRREPPFTTRLPLRCVDPMSSGSWPGESRATAPLISRHISSSGGWTGRPQVKVVSTEPPVTVQARLSRPGIPSIETPRRHFCLRDPGTRNAAGDSSTAPEYCLVTPGMDPQRYAYLLRR